jgi:hypothetical protein
VSNHLCRLLFRQGQDADAQRLHRLALVLVERPIAQRVDQGQQLPVGGWIAGALLFPPYGVPIWAVSELVELASVGTPWDQLETGNPTDVLIDTGATIAESTKLIPRAGSVGNVASLIVNLSEGFYQTP